MPPEYVLGGAYSEKTDVYSFGVLLLEIVSGQRIIPPDSKGGNLSLIRNVSPSDLILVSTYIIINTQCMLPKFSY